MIVRDEESHLTACLESIRHVVDEIVIVDTGSRDGTITIAESFGARVHSHQWRGDFAAARNVGLDLARGEWILYIDADERLRPIAPDLVRSRLEHASEIALRVRLRPLAGWTPYWEFRLWRSDPRIRFEGVIHEKMTPSIRRVTLADRRTIGESELFLEHVGYDGDQTHKHRRNLPLLRAQLATDPSSAYNWSHLGEVLEGLGRAQESEQAFERAVQIARESGPSAGALAFAELVRQRKDQSRDWEELLDEAVTHYPDNIALAWKKVCALIDAYDFDRALRWLELFDVDTEMPVEDTVAYPAELFRSRAADARGLCLFKLGQYREAAEAYRQAERQQPDDQATRLRRALAEHRADLSSERKDADTRPGRWAARDLLAGVAVEIGGVSVGLRATDAMRARAMHSVLGRMAPADRDPDVQIDFLGHRIPLPQRTPDVREGDLELWYDDSGLSAGYGPALGASVEGSYAVVGGEHPDLRSVFHNFSQLVLGSLLASRGSFVLHGGAIQNNGRAVLILGDTGAGKSTLVFGALEDGWRALSDDLVVIRSSPAGPVVSGILKPMVVPGELLKEDADAEPLRDPRGRVMLTYEAWDRSWRPIRAIIASAHGREAPAKLETLGRPELLGLLVRSLISKERPHIRTFMRLAIGLIDVPAYRLFHSDEPTMRARNAARALAGDLLITL